MIKYAVRLETKRVAERNFPYVAKPFGNPQDMVSFCHVLQDSDIEKLLVLYLDNGNRLNCIQIWEGTVDRTYLYPREIIKHAILSASNQIVLVHNHPGEAILEPSPQDVEFTQSFKKTCALLEISMLDHIIIGSAGKFYSFKLSQIL